MHRYLGRALLLIVWLGLACAAAPASALDLSQLPYASAIKNPQGVEAYEKAPSPKALALHESGREYWWGSQASEAEAARRALEACEIVYKSPCRLGAVDDQLQRFDAATPPVSVFATLGRELDAAKTPLLTAVQRQNLSNLLEQLRSTSPKYMALALHERGGWFLSADPQTTSQAAADLAALEQCKAFPPPNKYWVSERCFIFAEGSQIVVNLPRTTLIATAAPQAQGQTNESGDAVAMKQALLNPNGFNVDWTCAQSSGQSHVTFREEGSRIVIDINNYSRGSCKSEAKLTETSIIWNGCNDYGIALSFNKDNRKTPFNGRSSRCSYLLNAP